MHGLATRSAGQSLEELFLRLTAPHAPTTGTENGSTATGGTPTRTGAAQ